MLVDNNNFINIINTYETEIDNFSVTKFESKNNAIIFEVIDKNTFENLTGFITKVENGFELKINQENEELEIKRGTAFSFVEEMFQDTGEISCDYIKTLFHHKKDELLEYIDTNTISTTNNIIENKNSTTIKTNNKNKNTSSIKNNKELNFANLNFGKIEDEKEEAFYLNAGLKPVLLYGPQATGKSRSMREIYNKLKKNNPNVEINFYQKELTKEMDRSDLIGMASIKENTYTYEIMSKAAFAARDNKFVIMGIDEVFRIKDNSPLFNLHGNDYYEIKTGRQLDFVRLELENGNKMWFQLYDTKPNNDVKIEEGKIKLDINKYKDLLNIDNEQIVENASAHGEIPVLRYKDYEKYNLDDSLDRSFNSQELIKAPVKNMLVILAGNVGHNFIQNFSLGMDLAFDSRFSLIYTKPFSIEFMSNEFRNTLLEAKKNDMLKWKLNDIQTDKKIDDFYKYVKTFFTQLEKMERNDKTISTAGKVDFRVFKTLANQLTRIKTPEKEDLAALIEKMKYSILDTKQGNNGLVIANDFESYFKTALKEIISESKELKLDTTALNPISTQEESIPMIDIVSSENEVANTMANNVGM